MLAKLLLCSVLLLSGGEEHVVKLKSGKKIFGTVIERTDKVVKIKRRGMIVEIPVDRIKSIKKTSGAITKEKQAAAEETEAVKETSKKESDGLPTERPGTKPGQQGEKAVSKDYASEDVETLMKAAIEGGFEDLEPVWERIKEDPLKYMKTHMKAHEEQPDIKKVELLSRLISTYFEGQAHYDGWVWFLRFAEGKNLIEGLKFLKSDKNRISSLKACLVGLAYKKSEGELKRIRKCCDYIFKVLPKKERAELADLVVSRTRVGPMSNRVYAASLVVEHDWYLTSKNWKFLFTLKTEEVRSIIVKHALKENVDAASRDNLEGFYLSEKDDTKKLYLMEMLNEKAFNEELNMTFMKEIHKDCRLSKSKKLRQAAFNQLSKGTGHSWQPADSRWADYFKEE